MTSDEIFDLIEYVGSDTSKNHKIAALSAHAGDDRLKTVMALTYNQLITYGIKKTIIPIGHGDGQFNDDTLEILTQLHLRKLTGGAALAVVRAEMERLTEKSSALLWRIVTRDMRAGFDAETVNKVWPKLVPDFPYMRCSLPKKVKLAEFYKDGAISQEKADGTYVNVDVGHTGEVQIRTRQGNEYPAGAMDPLIEQLATIIDPGTQVHGELVLYRDGKLCDRADGNGVFTHVRAGGDFAPNEVPQLLVWDAIPLVDAIPKGKFTAPYWERLLNLAVYVLDVPTGLVAKAEDDPHTWLPEVLKCPQMNSYVGIVDTRIVKDHAEAMAHYAHNLRLGKEGSVVKKWNAIWRDGTSLEQIKLKLCVPVELRIEGYVEGNGKFVGTCGAIKMRSECGRLKVNVNPRGDLMREELWKKRDVYMDAICTVSGNAIMKPSDSNPDYSLFLPVLVELDRTDKTAANTLEEIHDEFDNAVKA